jgi:hypothetical protein
MMVQPVMFCNLLEHHSALQHWAKISASGATSIEDLNNSTLHFTDVNGSSLSGTTSEVVKQMVAMRYSYRYPTMRYITPGASLSLTQHLRLRLASLAKTWFSAAAPPYMWPTAWSCLTCTTAWRQAWAPSACCWVRTRLFCRRILLAALHFSFLTRSRLFCIAGVSHLHKVDRHAHAEAFQVPI